MSEQLSGQGNSDFNSCRAASFFIPSSVTVVPSIYNVCKDFNLATSDIAASVTKGPSRLSVRNWRHRARPFSSGSASLPITTLRSWRFSNAAISLVLASVICFAPTRMPKDVPGSGKSLSPPGGRSPGTVKQGNTDRSAGLSKLSCHIPCPSGRSQPRYARCLAQVVTTAGSTPPVSWFFSGSAPHATPMHDRADIATTARKWQHVR